MDLNDRLDLQHEHGLLAFNAIADAIRTIRPRDMDELIVHAERIRLCNSRENFWKGKDLHDQDGVLYDGIGSFWSCHSKLCPGCLKRESLRRRKQLRQAIEKQVLHPHEHYYFVTFTIPNPGLPLLQTRDLIAKAWVLLRKRKFFKDTVIGAAKSEEFTLTKAGYHYHIHAIFRSKYLHYKTLRQEWTECLRETHAREEMTIDFKTIDGLSYIDAKRVHDLKNVQKEICKYITKTSLWKDLDQDSLLDLARIKRYPRMFELLGSFRANIPTVACSGEEHSKDIKTILDKNSLSDGDSCETWRSRVKDYGVAEYLQILHDQFIETVQIRKHQLRNKYPIARFSMKPMTRPLSPDEILLSYPMQLDREPCELCASRNIYARHSLKKPCETALIASKPPLLHEPPSLETQLLPRYRVN